MESMPEMPKLKDICPVCGKKYLHVRKHLLKFHPNGQPSTAKLRGTNKPEFFANTERNELQENADTAPILENNPEIDRISQTVAEEEAKFGIVPYASPKSEKRPNQSLESETEANPASDLDSEPNSASVSENNTIFDPEASNYILATVFNTLATLSKEPLWALEKEELEIVGPPLNRVINKHAPDFLKKYPDEIVLATVFASIFATKMQLINEKKKRIKNAGDTTNERKEPEPKPKREREQRADDLAKFKAID